MTYQEYLKAIAEQLKINYINSSSNCLICNAMAAYRNANRDSYLLFEEHEERLGYAIQEMISILSSHYFYHYATFTALKRYYAEIDNSETELNQLQARLRFLKELSEKA